MTRWRKYNRIHKARHHQYKPLWITVLGSSWDVRDLLIDNMTLTSAPPVTALRTGEIGTIEHFRFVEGR